MGSPVGLTPGPRTSHPLNGLALPVGGLRGSGEKKDWDLRLTRLRSRATPDRTLRVHMPHPREKPDQRNDRDDRDRENGTATGGPRGTDRDDLDDDDSRPWCARKGEKMLRIPVSLADGRERTDDDVLEGDGTNRRPDPDRTDDDRAGAGGATGWPDRRDDEDPDPDRRRRREPSRRVAGDAGDAERSAPDVRKERRKERPDDDRERTTPPAAAARPRGDPPSPKFPRCGDGVPASGKRGALRTAARRACRGHRPWKPDDSPRDVPILHDVRDPMPPVRPDLPGTGTTRKVDPDADPLHPQREGNRDDPEMGRETSGAHGGATTRFEKANRGPVRRGDDGPPTQ